MVEKAEVLVPQILSILICLVRKSLVTTRSVRLALFVYLSVCFETESHFVGKVIISTP